MSEEQEKDTPGISRRKFVTTVAATGAALTIVPRHVLGRGFQAPSDTLNIATVGINGQGFTNTRNLMGENIVAICDVDYGLLDNALSRAKAAAGAPGTGGSGQQRRANPSKAQLEANARRPATNVSENTRKFVDQQMPKLKRYKDYREMLDKQKDIDGGRRRHARSHARADRARRRWTSASTSTSRSRCAGRSQEARHLAQKAKTHEGRDADGQPGTLDATTREPGRSISPPARSATCARFTSGPTVRSATGRRAFRAPRRCRRTIRSGRCAGTARASKHASRPRSAGNYPVPDGLVVGSVPRRRARRRISPDLSPVQLARLGRLGQGALGDMGAHLIDHPFWALDLGMPTTIETISTPFNSVCYPNATTTYYEFAGARQHAGGEADVVRRRLQCRPSPRRSATRELNGEGGVLYIGSKGKMLQDTYGAQPAAAADVAARVLRHAEARSSPRITHEEHEMNWVEAIKGKAEISCPFDYAARLTEVMLLGVVSLRAGGKIVYDGAAGTRDQLGQERQQHRRSQSVPGPRLPLGLETDIER